LLSRKARAVLKLNNGEEIEEDWRSLKCLSRGNYTNSTTPNLEAHIRNRHKEMPSNIQQMGEFWGITRTVVEKNPRIRIEGLFREGG
jgi:hypothetical protein